MKKKRKNNSFLFSMIALILLSVTYAGIMIYNNHQADVLHEDAADTVTLLAMDHSVITEITFTREDGTYHFKKEDDSWKSAEEPDLTFRQTYIDNMARVFSSTDAVRTIRETTDHLSEYGLETPVYEVIAKDEAGNQARICIGMKNETTGDYYAYVDGIDGIYTVKSGTVGYFQYSLYQMVVTDALPYLTTDLITRVELEWDGNSMAVEQIKGGSIYDPSNLQLWFVTKPFAHEYVASSGALDSLFEHMTELSYESTVINNADEMKLKEYGLLDAKSSFVIDYKGVESDLEGNIISETMETYHLLIGGQNEKGSYYVMPNGSKNVYTMSGANIDALFAKQAEDYIYKYFSIVHVQSVDSIDIITADKTYTLEVETVTSVADGSEVKDYIYSYQGDTLVDTKADAASKLFSSIISLAAERIHMEPGEPGESIDFSVVFHRNMEPQEYKITFTDYNVSYYLANVNADAIYLVNKRDLEEYRASLVAAFDALGE